MLDAVPEVVRAGPADSWGVLLRILWESGFRVSDVLRFTWDDQTGIQPVWSSDDDPEATLTIPGTTNA